MEPIADDRPTCSASAERSARRREQILEAAITLFAEHGYPDTDMQVLADTIQVGKGTLYRYFPSKRELFLAAADHVMRRLRHEVDGAIEGIPDPLDRIAQAIRSFLGFFAAHPEYVELLMQERAQFKDRKKPTYLVHREANVHHWQVIYGNLIAEGRLRDMPVERITSVISDLLYGTMFTNYFAGPNKPFEEQARDILDIVFNGILSPTERQRRGA
jgi:AcrR family transcriptional regulator